MSRPRSIRQLALGVAALVGCGSEVERQTPPVPEPMRTAVMVEVADLENDCFEGSGEGPDATVAVRYRNVTRSSVRWDLVASTVVFADAELELPLSPPTSGWVGPGEALLVSHGELGDPSGFCGQCDERGELRLTWEGPEGAVHGAFDLGAIGCSH